MTIITILLWVYVIGAVITALVFGLAFRYAERREAEMEADVAREWNKIKMQAEFSNLSLTGFAVLLGFFWPWFLYKRS